MRVALGLALTTIVGGPLNLFGWFSLTTVRIYLAIGLAGTIVSAMGRVSPTQTRWPRWAGVAVVGAGIVMIALSVVGGAVHAFNPHDDLHAYLDFPVRMLQTGSLGADPFSERRMLEYGGQTVLYALVLGLVDVASVHILECGVAAVAVFALIVEHARRRRASPWVALVSGVFFFTAPAPIENLTSVITGMALFYAVLLTLSGSDDFQPIRRIATLTILIAGLLAMKVSHLPGLGLMLAGGYLLADKRPWSARIREVLTITVCATVLLAPWMIAMLRSSGTLMYPLLGQGYSGSVYSRFIPVTAASWTLAEFTTELRALLETPAIVVGAVLAATVGAFGRSAGARIALWCSSGAYVAAWLVNVANGGMGPRYSWAFTFTCLLFTLIEALSPAGVEATAKAQAEAETNQYGEDRARGGWRAAQAIVPVAGLATLAILGWLHEFRSDEVHPSLLAGGYRALRDGVEPPDMAAGTQSLRGLQTFVPAGERLLARLSRPYQLNFARNTVYIVDWPGGASLPPGMPIEQTAEDLAAYLRAHDIRYVIYSYGDEAGYPVAGFGHRIRPGTGYVARARVTTELTFAFQQRLRELGQTYPRLADDGQAFVLDLSRPIASRN
ncbi:MAG TPA: hypothetical protein VJP86_07505 [Vicinamibacterales bacterium]|nr:hypothetical protein [Vicinamibacterales bacterium]